MVKQTRFLTLSMMAVLLLAALPAAAGPTVTQPAALQGLGSVGAAQTPAHPPIQLNALDPNPAWSSPEVSQALGTAWGDWDNDGDLDLAFSGNGLPTCLYENVGGWLDVTAAWCTTESDHTHDLAWGDWDNDGDLDLATGNYNGPNRVYENEGGTLTPVWSSTEEDNTSSVAWADWDADGDLDLATGGWERPTRVYENQGGDLVLAWSAAEQDWTMSVAWGDWDGDGDPDLAAGNAGQPNRVYENDGGVLTLAWSSTEEDDTYSVAWGDWDGDGDLDLAAGNAGQPNRVYENDGGVLTLAWSSTEEDDTYSVAWGDWDSDGDLDLVAGNEYQPSRVYENTGGSLTPAAVWASAESDPTDSVAWGDWNNDGDLELAAGNGAGFLSLPNRVYENLAGPMATQFSWSAPRIDSTMAVAWGDYDGDGDLDLAVANQNQPSRIYENVDGNLELAWSSPENDTSAGLAWGDWDSDGDLDLAVANNGFNRLYQNDGGTFSLAWAAPETGPSTSVAWGDYDGDGDLDLAFGNEFRPIQLYENGGMTLTLAWSSTEQDNTRSVAWGDWDNDGDLDLAAGNGSHNRLYQNDGLTLTLAWSAPDQANTTSVAWGDYDGDGDLDLAVGNAGEPNQLYENDGGTLSLAWSSTESDETNAVAWADWDGDGDLDLAAGNWNNPNRVYENLAGALGPDAAWSSPESAAAHGLAWGDYDGDGDMDLAVANSDQPVRLYRNNRVSSPTLPNNAAYPVVYRPGSSDDAYFFSSAEILTSASVPIWFRLFDAEGDHVPRITARYSTDGGGQWLPATITGTTTFLSASPTGVLHSVSWNALADGARGDNVMFRLTCVLDNPRHVAYPIQRPYTSATTTPFRLRPLALALLPFRQLGFGPGGTVVTHTLTLVNRTGHTGLFAVGYDSFRGWPVQGPNMVGPIPEQGSSSFVVTATVPGGPAGVLDVVTATTAALFNPATFQAHAYLFTFRGVPDVNLSIAKDGPANIRAGAVMTYTLVAHNAGPSPASGVVVADTLPAEVTFAWAGQEGVYSPTLGTVLWPDHLLFAGQSLTFTVAVTTGCVPSGTLIVNDNYGVASNEYITPVYGAAVNTTVLYDAPVAAMSIPANLPAGIPFTTTNLSINASAFLWEFGDGITSTLAEPMHTYALAGHYTIALTAYGDNCGSDQTQAAVTATIYLAADFQHNAPVCLGQPFVVTNTTTGLEPISYEWEFGDGLTSTLENPTHIYAADGSYSVVLHAANGLADDWATAMVEVLPLPTAGFTYTLNDLAATFTNLSTNSDSYLWSFGDGVTSTLEHPVHTYTVAGAYTVTLTASGECGTDEVSLSIPVGGAVEYRVFLPVVAKGYGVVAETELAYDDGGMESAASWDTGRGYAACFTPPGGQAQLLRARYYLQDPQPIEVHVWSADTHADLLSPFQASPTAEGWNDVDLTSYNLTVSSGFCVGFLHLADYRPTLGVDTSAPDNQSYEVDGDYWQLQGYDAMIRIVVEP